MGKHCCSQGNSSGNGACCTQQRQPKNLNDVDQKCCKKKYKVICPKDYRIPLRMIKSRELRGGKLYTDCFCLRRNGLQHDCMRNGCRNDPRCDTLPAPCCEQARVTCLSHYRNPHAEAHTAICRMRH